MLRLGVKKVRVAIGTENKAKIGAVESVVRKVLPLAVFETIDIPSNVSAQPITDEETRQGAINRAVATRDALGAEFSFGLEGGVREIDGQMYVCNWGALALVDNTVLTAAGAQIVLPKEIADHIRAGEELGPVMDEFTKKKDIRSHAGAVGIFTNGLIDRKEMFEHIVRLLVGQYLYKKGCE